MNSSVAVNRAATSPSLPVCPVHTVSPLDVIVTSASGIDTSPHTRLTPSGSNCGHAHEGTRRDLDLDDIIAGHRAQLLVVLSRPRTWAEAIGGVLPQTLLVVC